MKKIADEEEVEKTPNLKNIDKLVEEFVDSGLKAYHPLVTMLNQERLLSACKLNEKRYSIDMLEREISEIEA